MSLRAWMIDLFDQLIPLISLFVSLAACTSSQEWTMSQTIQELHLVRISASPLQMIKWDLMLNSYFLSLCICMFCALQGVLGGLCSGKSALVHRHLTGSYLQVENAEGWFHISPHLQLLCTWHLYLMHSLWWVGFKQVITSHCSFLLCICRAAVH